MTCHHRSLHYREDKKGKIIWVCDDCSDSFSRKNGALTKIADEKVVVGENKENAEQRLD